jgi:membrane fusion protein (multidrug efflux system)
MSASVRVVTAEQPAGLLVPTEAVVMSGARASVWVLGVDGAVALRPIEAGQRSRASVQVRAGLEAGEQVIIEGLARMKPGVKAVVAAPAEAPAAGAEAPAAGTPPQASP